MSVLGLHSFIKMLESASLFLNLNKHTRYTYSMCVTYAWKLKGVTRKNQQHLETLKKS